MNKAPAKPKRFPRNPVYVSPSHPTWRVLCLGLLTLITVAGITTANAETPAAFPAMTVQDFLDPGQSLEFKATGTPGVYSRVDKGFTGTLTASKTDPTRVAQMKLVARDQTAETVTSLILFGSYGYGAVPVGAFAKWFESKPFLTVFKNGGTVKKKISGVTYTLTVKRGVRTLLIVVPN
jgi:hypothetical protein